MSEQARIKKLTADFQNGKLENAVELATSGEDGIFSLAQEIGNQNSKKESRVAAIQALGGNNQYKLSFSALTEVLQRKDEEVVQIESIRALKNMMHEISITIDSLFAIVDDNTASPNLREETIYTLEKTSFLSKKRENVLMKVILAQDSRLFERYLCVRVLSSTGRDMSTFYQIYNLPDFYETMYSTLDDMRDEFCKRHPDLCY